MVRTKGPLLSLEASGAIGKTLIASNWKGRSYTKKLSIPSNPKSPAQVHVRAILTYLNNHWPNISDANQATWLEPAAAAVTTLPNAYTHENLTRWSIAKMPSDVYPVAPIHSAPGHQTPSAIPQGRGIRISWVIPPFQPDGGIVLYQSMTSGPAQDYTQAIRLWWLDGSANYVWLHTPLDPGTYYFRLRTFSWDGKNGAYSAQFSAIVT